MKLRNKSGITLIALIVTIIVLIIIAGISIATLTADNGILRQTNSAKVSQIEGTAREQVNLACAAMRLAVAEAQAKDNSYSAKANSSLIQAKLIDVLEADKKDLTGNFTDGGTPAGDNQDEITIVYEGDDYTNATNNPDAKITYTIGLSQKTVALTNEVNTTLKDQSGNDVVLDIGSNEGTGSGSGSGSGEGGDSGSTSGTSLATVASIGDYVNYDPTSGGNATSENTTYTSVAGSTTSHGNGYTTDTDGQTFSAANYKNAGGKWRILDIDENGTITLISDLIYQDSGTTMGTTGLYLSNGIGYIYAEEELHRIASIYGHGAGADTSQTITYYYGGPNDQDGSITAGTVEAQQGIKTTLNLESPSGARALTVEDVNKLCGVDSTYTANYSSSTVTKVSNHAKYYPTISGTSSTGQSAAQTTFSGSYYYTYYYYSISSTNSDATAQSNQNEMLKLGTTYWLASRCVDAYSNLTHFYVRRVDSGGNVCGSYACGCNGGSWCSNYSPSYAVRSIITLNSEIQTSDTEYDSTTGWNLAI